MEHRDCNIDTGQCVPAHPHLFLKKASLQMIFESEEVDAAISHHEMISQLLCFCRARFGKIECQRWFISMDKRSERPLLKNTHNNDKNQG